MSWRECKSLLKLRDQVNAEYPGRDKSSDGTIGDANHATKKSDHNPWFKDAHGIGVVTAIDIDEDLAVTIHSIQKIVDNICASRDPRVKYIIYEGKITVKGSNLQQWKKYTGPNKHEHHVHISVFPEARFYDDETPWDIDGVAIPAAPAPEGAVTNYIVRGGDTLWGIARKFETSVDELKRLNGLTGDVIKVEQRLRVK